MKMQLHIDQIVLNDLPVSPRAASVIARSIERELSHLLQSDHAAIARAADSIHMDSPSIHVHPGQTPRGIGKQIAHSIYEGFRSCT